MLVAASYVIILGNFNIFSFSRHSMNLLNVILKTKTSCLLNFPDFNQHNSVHNTNDRLLDLVVSDKQCEDNKTFDILLGEDVYHSSLESGISFTRICEENYSPNPKLRTFKFRKANFLQLYGLLFHTNWFFIANWY
jgi:hypothetical protein